MNLKILAAASLTLLSAVSTASAQCVDCAMYPDRDHLNGGSITPAGKMGLVRPNGAAGVSSGPNEALASVRDQYMQESNATVTSLKKRATHRNNSAH